MMYVFNWLDSCGTISSNSIYYLVVWKWPTYCFVVFHLWLVAVTTIWLKLTDWAIRFWPDAPIAITYIWLKHFSNDSNEVHATLKMKIIHHWLYYWDMISICWVSLSNYLSRRSRREKLPQIKFESAKLMAMNQKACRPETICLICLMWIYLMWNVWEQ